MYCSILPQVGRAHHEEVLQAKEEELARALEERDQLKDQLKLTETKLDELKVKSNVSFRWNVMAVN